MEDDRDFSTILSRKCKRKEARKSKKKLNILCKLAFKKHKKLENVLEEELGVKKVDKKKEKKERQREARAQKKLRDADDLVVFAKEAAEMRKNVLSMDEERERDEIESLERKLGLKKKQIQGTQKLNNNASKSNDVSEKKAEEYVDNLFSALDDIECNVVSKLDNFDGEIVSNSSTDDSKNLLNELNGSINNDNDDNDNDIDSNNDVNLSSDNDLRQGFPATKKESLHVEEEDGDEKEEDVGSEDLALVSKKFDKKILALARKANMNTPLKEQIFCTIMSSMNSSEAFTNLEMLLLKGPDEREIVVVCIKCALLEAHYNPYYSVLIAKFCETRKQFRLTLQFALWDTMKSVQDLKPHKLNNLICLFADLIKLQAVGLTVFKVVELRDLDSRNVAFVRQVLYRLFTKAPDATQRQTFMRMINSNKNQRFTDELEDFLAKWDTSEFEKLTDFNIFQRQLAMVMRLFAVR